MELQTVRAVIALLALAQVIAAPPQVPIDAPKVPGGELNAEQVEGEELIAHRIEASDQFIDDNTFQFRKNGSASANETQVREHLEKVLDNLRTRHRDSVSEKTERLLTEAREIIAVVNCFKKHLWLEDFVKFIEKMLDKVNPHRKFKKENESIESILQNYIGKVNVESKRNKSALEILYDALAERENNLKGQHHESYFDDFENDEMNNIIEDVIHIPHERHHFEVNDMNYPALTDAEREDTNSNPATDPTTYNKNTTATYDWWWHSQLKRIRKDPGVHDIEHPESPHAQTDKTREEDNEDTLVKEIHELKTTSRKEIQTFDGINRNELELTSTRKTSLNNDETQTQEPVRISSSVGTNTEPAFLFRQVDELGEGSTVQKRMKTTITSSTDNATTKKEDEKEDQLVKEIHELRSTIFNEEQSIPKRDKIKMKSTKKSKKEKEEKEKEEKEKEEKEKEEKEKKKKEKKENEKKEKEKKEKEKKEKEKKRKITVNDEKSMKRTTLKKIRKSGAKVTSTPQKVNKDSSEKCNKKKKECKEAETEESSEEVERERIEKKKKEKKIKKMKKEKENKDLMEEIHELRSVGFTEEGRDGHKLPGSQEVKKNGQDAESHNVLKTNPEQLSSYKINPTKWKPHSHTYSQHPYLNATAGRKHTNLPHNKAIVNQVQGEHQFLPFHFFNPPRSLIGTIQRLTKENYLLKTQLMTQANENAYKIASRPYPGPNPIDSFLLHGIRRPTALSVKPSIQGQRNQPVVPSYPYDMNPGFQHFSVEEDAGNGSQLMTKSNNSGSYPIIRSNNSVPPVSEFTDEMKRELIDGKVILLSDSVVHSNFDAGSEKDDRRGCGKDDSGGCGKDDSRGNENDEGENASSTE